MDGGDVNVNTKGLDKLLRTLKGKLPVAHVGIMGGKNARAENKKTLTYAEISAMTKPHKTSNLTNADIGAKHEFGDPAEGIPMRSFLRVPLSDLLVKRMTAAGAYTTEALNNVVKQGTLLPWVKKMAVLAEGIVQEAFATGGFGKWPPHAPGYTNNTGDLLVDTTQLKNSITSEVTG